MVDILSLSGKELEKFLLKELINEITIRKKGRYQKFTTKELEELEVPLELSRSLVQGLFGKDVTKAKNPSVHTKNRLAQLDGAYENFDDFSKKFLAKARGQNFNINTFTIQGHLTQHLKNYYRQNTSFTSINILGAPVDQQFLSVSDFYIDISYIDRIELSSDNDFFTIEKEGFLHKKARKTRNEIFTNYFSVESVSENLIFRDKHVVLIGNPGVGKTTYAKWLCHMWSKGQLSIGSVPIYIPCRELIGSSSNSILTYINEAHYKGAYNELLFLFNQSDFQYILLLDGYDEASSEQRQFIEQDLRRISSFGSYPPFALFTRPYALIDSPFKKIPSLYELLGFNDANLLKYTTNFFERQNKPNEIEPFLNFVTQSDLLRDLIHNPLYLSYIASIYCSKNGKTKLKSIQSTYDLNKEAINFIIEYHTSEKNIDRNLFGVDLRNCMPFVAEMELNLSFVYHQKGPLDPNYSHAQTMSKLGLGRVEYNRSNHQWSFYLLNVFYQEILAAEYLGPKLSQESLLTILKNPLHWHFSKLLIGFLISHKKEATIISLLAHTKRKSNKIKNFEYYLYFIILSEVPGLFINEHITVKDIGELIDLYEYLHGDSLWNNLYFECLANIYRKLNQTNKEIFDKKVLANLQKAIIIPKTVRSVGLSFKQINSLSIPEYLVSIIERLELYNSQQVANNLLSLFLRIEQLNSRYSRWIEKDIDNYDSLQHLASETIKSSTYTLLILLYQVDNPILLKKHSDDLWRAYENSYDHADLVIKIIAQFTSSVHFIKKFDSWARSKKDMNMLLVLTCVGMAGSFDCQDYKAEIKKRLIIMKDLLIQRWGEIGRRKESYRKDYSTYAMAITLFNDISLLPYLVWANCFEGGAYNFMRDVSFAESKKIIDLFFRSKSNRHLSVMDFEELHATIGSLKTGSLALEALYDQFYFFFTTFIESNQPELNRIAEFRTSDGFLGHIVAYELYSCGNSLYYPSRIKRFLTDIFSSKLINNKFIKLHYVPYLMSCNVPLFEKKLHDFILNELMKENADPNIVIHLFSSNQVIYWYDSNIKFLELFWLKFAPMLKVERSKEFWEERLPAVLSIAYSSLKLNFTSSKSFQVNDLVKSICSFIEQPKVIKYLLTNDVFYRESCMVDVAIFPLLFLHTKNDSFLLPNEFYVKFNELDRKRKGMLFNELIQISNNNYEIFKSALPVKLFKQLKTHTFSFGAGEKLV